MTTPTPERRAAGREAIAGALCASGKFETGHGGCAAICMSMLGSSRPRCDYKQLVHGALADAILALSPDERGRTADDDSADNEWAAARDGAPTPAAPDGLEELRALLRQAIADAVSIGSTARATTFAQREAAQEAIINRLAAALTKDTPHD